MTGLVFMGSSCALGQVKGSFLIAEPVPPERLECNPAGAVEERNLGRDKERSDAAENPRGSRQRSCLRAGRGGNDGAAGTILASQRIRGRAAASNSSSTRSGDEPASQGSDLVPE